jgi:hypothetical protein
MMPLLFWFNMDPRLAVPSVSIPYGQRFLSIDLAGSTDLIELVVPPLADGSDSGDVPTLTVAECSLFINNIFVNPEVHDIFIKRIGFSLIRVHRMQTTRVKDDNANVLLNNMKWPIEFMFVAVRPVVNVTNGVFPDNNALQTWHQFGVTTETTQDVDGVASCVIDTTAQQEVADFLDEADVAGTAAAQLTAYNALAKTTAAGSALFALAGAAASEAAATSGTVVAAVQAADTVANGDTYFVHPTKDGSCAQVDVRTKSPTVSKLSITAHGIDIYKEMPGTFFHSYTPYTYGGHNVSAPTDPGAHMITFCLYPGSYQPSGHVNVSRAREFYLRYWSEGAVSSDDPADLIVIASAINFLLISDGSAVLRYST